MYDKVARFYDLTHAELREDIDLIVQLAAQANGPVLELGCGTGRLLRPLFHAGCQVVGVDNSTAMLTLARDHLAQEPAAVQQRIQLVEQDFTKLTLPKDLLFEFALIPYNTFLHLDSRGKRATLQRVRGYLGENGRLFIDVVNPYLLANLLPDEDYLLENDLIDQVTKKRVEQFARTELLEGEQVVQVHWLYREEGGVETAVSANYHYLYPHELDLLLQQTGFQMSQLWGSYDKTPFTQESERMIMVAAPK